jgi:hypothetical protein
MDKDMKTMVREIREEIKVLRKELAAVKEEMRGREEKGQAEKADWKKRNNVIITGIGGNKWKYREGGGRMVRKGDRGESKDKMILVKIESWEHYDK